MKHRKLLATFRLPLELCPTENRAGPQHGGARAGIRAKCKQSMVAQAISQGLHIGTPFPFGVLIRCIRYSTTAPDSTGWDKVPIDCMLPSTTRNGKRIHRLGLLVDDSPAHVTRVHHHERAARGRGRVVIELWSPSTMGRTELMRELDALVIGCDDAARLHVVDYLSQ
jgi:hypothetical protein